MTDRGMPKCPWCGREMSIGYDGKGMTFGRCYFYCDCGAQAPCACVEYATPDDWIGIEGEAYLKATARPIQKPLTVEEVRGKDMVYLEERHGRISQPCLIDQISTQKDMYFISGMSEIFTHRVKAYNKFWRCWAIKPTDEERQAASWE